MTYRKTMVLLLGTVAAASLAGATPKEEAVAGLRESFSRRTPYIAGNLRSKTPEFLKLLDDNGSFRDLSELERKYRANGWGNPKYDYTEIQVPVLNMLVEAFNRLQVIALDLRDRRNSGKRFSTMPRLSLTGETELPSGVFTVPVSQFQARHPGFTSPFTMIWFQENIPKSRML